jgi:chromosomal replication initiation ATPase DnaA
MPVLAPRRAAPLARPVMIVPGANADAIRRELAARYARTPDDAIPAPLQRSARVKQIIREVATAYGISVDNVWSEFQRADDVLPRHEIFFRIRHETGLSYPQIAHKCGGPGGGRDMTTVFYAVQRAMPARLAAGWRMRTRPEIAGVGAGGLVLA